MAVLAAIMNANSIMAAAARKHPRAVRVEEKENAWEEKEPNKEWPSFLANREFMIQPDLKLPSTPAIAGIGTSGQ